MPVWHHTLKLADIFHSEVHSFTDKRDIIVKRIRTAPFYSEDDWTLPGIVDELADTQDTEDFDWVWGDFYDWADVNRVWVETF